MKILVTGATGFLARHVIPHLLDLGHTVVASARNYATAAQCDWLADLEFVPFDILRGETIDVSMFGKPDFLFHLAWGGLDNFSATRHLDKELPAHCLFLRQLIEDGLSQCCVIGTCLEYGRVEGALSESIPAQPEIAYAQAKHQLHKYLLNLQRDYSFRLCWVRLFYLHGPGQNPRSLLAQLDRALERDDDNFPMSPADQLRDYLPVERVAEIIAEIGLRTDTQGIVNCCSGKPISVRRLVENYLAQRNKTIGLRLGVYPYPSYEAKDFWGDTAKLDELLQK